MTEEYSDVVDGLSRNQLLPEQRKSVFVSGSIVRGWGNRTSDLDVTVITTEPWAGSKGKFLHVALTPDTISYEEVFVNGRRWDVAYWLDSQFEQLVDKVSWESFRGAGPWQTLTGHEISLLERLPFAIGVDRADWLAQQQRELAASAHRSVFASHDLHYADSYIEDAVGQCEAGDFEAATLSARLAFGHAIDGLLASMGEFGSKWPKWRARRFRNARPTLLNFEEYWTIETMREFDSSNPRKWIERVLKVCQKISMEVEL